MTIVGDLAQSTGPHVHESWAEVATALDVGQSQDIAELEYGYRVPKQVFDVARPVLEAAAPEVRAPDILRDVPFEPNWVFPTSETLAAAVADQVLERSRGYFMGVIAHPEQWDRLREAFAEAGINWAESTSGELSSAINLVTPEDAKGLEFDSVIVVDPQRIMDMRHGLRLLYTAITRTTTRLDFVVPRDRLPEILVGQAPALTALSLEADDAPLSVEYEPVPDEETDPIASVDNAPSPMPGDEPAPSSEASPSRSGHSDRFEALQPWAKPMVENYIAQQVEHLEGGDYSRKMIEAIVEEMYLRYVGNQP